MEEAARALFRSLQRFTRCPTSCSSGRATARARRAARRSARCRRPRSATRSCSTGRSPSRTRGVRAAGARRTAGAARLLRADEAHQRDGPPLLGGCARRTLLRPRGSPSCWSRRRAGSGHAPRRPSTRGATCPAPQRAAGEPLRHVGGVGAADDRTSSSWRTSGGAETAAHDLALIGLDRVAGHFAPEAVAAWAREPARRFGGRRDAGRDGAAPAQGRAELVDVRG